MNAFVAFSKGDLKVLTDLEYKFTSSSCTWNPPLFQLI